MPGYSLLLPVPIGYFKVCFLPTPDDAQASVYGRFESGPELQSVQPERLLRALNRLLAEVSLFQNRNLSQNALQISDSFAKGRSETFCRKIFFAGRGS